MVFKKQLEITNFYLQVLEYQSLAYIYYCLKFQVAPKDDVIFVFINPHGQEEKGSGTGVQRDAYCLFWNEVANSLVVENSGSHPFHMNFSRKNGLQLEIF